MEVIKILFKTIAITIPRDAVCGMDEKKSEATPVHKGSARCKAQFEKARAKMQRVEQGRFRSVWPGRSALESVRPLTVWPIA